MSIADTSTSHAGLGIGRLLTARLRSLADWLLRLDARAQDRAHLHAMPDHMLRDIGLTRDGIDEALRGAARSRRGSV